MCAERRQCHRTYIMCPVSSITRAEISMQRTFRSLVPVYIYIQETFAPAITVEDGNGSCRTKRMWDVVLSNADTPDVFTLYIIVSLVMYKVRGNLILLRQILLRFSKPTSQTNL